MAMFDTHRAVKKLTGAGFSEFQAEALIDAVGDEHEALATKADLFAIKAELRGEIAVLRAEVKEDIASVRAEIGTVRADLQSLELRMMLRLGGLVVAGVAVLAVLELIP